jgi:hypothetical protein
MSFKGDGIDVKCIENDEMIQVQLSQDAVDVLS